MYEHSDQPPPTRRSSVANTIGVIAVFIALLVGAVFLPIPDAALGLLIMLLGLIPLSLFIRGRPLLEFPRLHPVLQFVAGMALFGVLLLPLLVIFGLAFQCAGRID